MAGKSFCWGIFVSALILTSSPMLWAMTPNGPSCEGMLTITEEARREFDHVREYGVTTGVPNIEDFLSKDPNVNPVLLHPTLLLDAAGRIYSWYTYIPKTRIVNPAPFAHEYINGYPILSTPTKYNRGRFIIGNHRFVEKLVDATGAMANGSGSSKQMISFEGPAGTGKTELLDIINNVGEELTTSDPRHFMYGFEFVNLGDIRALDPLFIGQPRDADKSLRKLPTDFWENPLALFPSPYTHEIIKLGTKTVKEFAGVAPNPFLKLAPKTWEIWHDIIQYHINKSRPAKVTPEFILDVIKQHIRLKRHVHNQNGKAAKIDKQGRDSNLAALFFEQNPLIKFALTPGNANSYAYNYNGKVAAASGTALFCDEFPRSMQTFIDSMLGVTESKRIQFEGSPEVGIDFVVFSAGNDVSYASLGEAAAAMRDRSNIMPMRLPTHPSEVEKLAVQIYGTNQFFMRKLTSIDEPEAPLEPLNIMEAYKHPEKLEETYKTTDRRYALHIKGENGELISVAPHAFALMAYIAVSTRMSFDVNKAEALNGTSQVLGMTQFKTHVGRIKAILKEDGFLDNPANAAAREELGALHLLLREGTNGLSQRHLSRNWIPEMLREAKRPENRNTITIQIVLRTFERLMQEEAFSPGLKLADYAKWMKYKDAILMQLVVPRVVDDITAALGSTRENVEETYNEFLMSERARKNDPNARSFRTDMEERTIQPDLILGIEKYYKEETGRDFEIDELMNFFPLEAGRTTMTHPAVMKAVQRWLGEAVLVRMSPRLIAQLANNASIVNPQDREIADDIFTILKRQYGYNETSVRSALKLFHDAKLKKTDLSAK